MSFDNKAKDKTSLTPAEKKPSHNDLTENGQLTHRDIEDKLRRLEGTGTGLSLYLPLSNMSTAEADELTGGADTALHSHPGGVDSVTGDGVDNTDPANPVLTFPTPAEIGAQPVDADLTAIAALAPSDDDVIQRKAGAWVNRTIAQLVTDLQTVTDTLYIAKSLLTTRGDIITRSATIPQRLALGAAGSFLHSDGTDAVWSTGFLAITAAKTLTVANNLTLSGTDGESLVLTKGLTITTNAGTIAFGAAALTLTIPESMVSAGRDVANTFSAAQTIAPASPTDGTDLMKFTTERAWTLQQASTAGNAMLEFFSDTAGKYVRINPNTTASGGLIVADSMPGGTLERFMVEGTGNIKGQVSTLSSTGYAFQRLKNDVGHTLDFGINGSARTGTVFGIANSAGGVGLMFINAASGPLAIGTTGAHDISIVGNNAVRISVQSLITNQVSVNYAADAQASDTYVITLAPALLAYSAGLEITFKANTANTGAATLNVNGLGAKTIVKAVSTALANNDILAGMFCKVIYDGTNFVLQNPRAL